MTLSCPACYAQVVERVESVPVEAIADAWAREKCHGENVTSEGILQFIRLDLKVRRVEFWQCRKCGLEFAQPMRSWTAQHYPIEQHSLGFDHQVALSELAAMSPTRVLDIGCADGQFLEQGAALGHKMVGIDFAKEDVTAANSRGLSAYVADVNEISKIFLRKPKFSVITLFQIIEHLTEPDKIFSQINEIAEVNALLIIGCPSDLRYTRRTSHQQRIQRSDFWDYPPQHTLRWTPKALELFLMRHGWHVQKVMYEPLSIIGAGAHITALRSLASAKPRKRWQQRASTSMAMIQMAYSKLFSNTTGIRLAVKARCKL